MKIIIVGGGAAGATAAQFARKQSRDADIIVFEKGRYPEYSRCGMPNVLSGEIPAFEGLIEYSVGWFERNRIELRLSTEVTSINVTEKKVDTVGPNGSKSESYDSLIFATGAHAAVPRIDGVMIDGKLREGAFLFGNMDDAKALGAWCSASKRRVLVVGAGLVGLEVADALNAQGHSVTVVEYLDAILPAMIDPDMAASLVDAMAATGVEVTLSSSVDSVIGTAKLEGARLSSRADSLSRTIDCDTVVISTGQKPTSDLAGKAGCALGGRGHVKVDDRCATSVEGVFAVGDCSEYRDLVTGDASPAGLGTLAVKMGAVAGKNAAGGRSTLAKGFVNSRVTRLFGLEIAATGPLSSVLAKKGMNNIQSRIKGSTLPPYFPGGKELLVKLVASEDGRILSCQIIGAREAALRIDIVSSLIAAGRGVNDLIQLENAYAPSVAPCVDALAVAAQGILIKLGRANK